jgi:hypothetical protein
LTQERQLLNPNELLKTKNFKTYFFWINGLFLKEKIILSVQPATAQAGPRPPNHKMYSEKKSEWPHLPLSWKTPVLNPINNSPDSFKSKLPLVVIRIKPIV